MMSSPSSQPRRLILVVGLILQPVAARRGGPRGGIYGFGIIGGPPALTATFFVAIAILVLGVVFGAYACYRYQQRKNWNQRVDQAEEAVWQNAMQNNKKPMTEATVAFRTCTFTTSYKERNGDNCTSKGTLEFTATQETLLTTSKEGHSSCVATPCLAITGHGTNQNGTFVVKRGKLSPATGLCYWLEEATEKKACLKESKQVLITGRFSLSKGGSANIDEFLEGRWASYHDWGWVTDGTMDQFDLLSKAGSVVSKK